MTELELYLRSIPDIAEIIVNLRKKTPKQQAEWKQGLLDAVSGMDAYAQRFIGKVTIVIDKYLKESEGQQEMRIEDIKIYPCFVAHPPKAEKMGQKARHYEETGGFQSEIVLNSEGNLIDGYTSYLLAKAYGIQCVPVRYGRRQVVRARHKPGGKLYTWELPGTLIDQVSAGDKVPIHTQRGVKVVTVAAVEEYAGNEPEPLRMVIRVKRKGGVGFRRQLL